MDELYNGLVNRANAQMGELQKRLEIQKNREEQERLRKIQQEMENERKMREAEEAKKREEEELKKKSLTLVLKKQLIIFCLQESRAGSQTEN